MEPQVELVHAMKFDILLSTMKAHEQTCGLLAELPPAAKNKHGKEKDHTLYVAELSIVHGQVRSCLIRGCVSGRVYLEGHKALDYLRRCEALSWTVQHAPPSSPFPSLHPSSKKSRYETAPTPLNVQMGSFLCSPPRCLHRIEKDVLEGLTHRQRQVLLLVNGHRGIEEMSRLLNCTPDQLVAVLDELTARNLIT